MAGDNTIEMVQQEQTEDLCSLFRCQFSHCALLCPYLSRWCLCATSFFPCRVFFCLVWRIVLLCGVEEKRRWVVIEEVNLKGFVLIPTLQRIR